MRRKRRTYLAVAALSVVSLLLGACGADDGGSAGGDIPDGPTITVSSFNFPESTILAEIYAQAMEEAGYPIERTLDVGSRELIYPEIEDGSIDFLPEYLGSALVVGFQQDAPENADAGIEDLRAAFEEQGIEVLEYAPAENSNVFVTTAEFAEDNGVTAIGDLADAGDIVFTGPPECEERATCFAGLQQVYGLDNVSYQSVQEAAARLASLQSGESQLTLLFSTDAVFGSGELVQLDDPEEMIPPENIVPIIRAEALEAYGDDLRSLINGITGQLETETLIDLNSRASEGESPEDIAADWLAENA